MSIEWVSACMLAGLAGIVTLAANLITAIWRGRWPHPLPTGGAFLVVVVTSLVLARGASATEPVLVAGATLSEPSCEAISRLLRVRPVEATTPNRVSGLAPLAEGCGIWALIEDPRTGTRWLQGPATQSGPWWDIDLVVGTGAILLQGSPYRLVVVQVTPEIHEAWLAAALRHVPLTLGHSPIVDAWLASPLAVVVGSS